MSDLKLIGCATCKESNVVNNPRQVELIPRMIKLLEQYFSTSDDPRIFIQIEILLKEYRERGCDQFGIHS